MDIARTGTPCVLEVGLTTRQGRTTIAAKVREAGLASRLYHLDVDAKERWRRVQLRNADASAPGQLCFAVTREMFDFVEGMWECPTDEELAEHDGVRISGAG